mgnify:CR=1 FL=1
MLDVCVCVCIAAHILWLIFWIHIKHTHVQARGLLGHFFSMYIETEIEKLQKKTEKDTQTDRHTISAS